MSKPAPEAPRPRSAARLAAVQALYQMDLAEAPAEDVIADFRAGTGVIDRSEGALGGADEGHFVNILNGVVAHQDAIDKAIHGSLAAGWTLARIDSLLRALLRAGVYELQQRADIPARVILKEYLQIADAFFEADEARFVNGVLDRIGRQARAGEFNAPVP
ncbi:MAG: transcription antitermination factor NusB [Alphaproteobacteria bacterium]|nr:transcription antitermination factor NusB [Alphaproteobacteria bacterium]